MAVATPVLERKIEDKETRSEQVYTFSREADEYHNACIRENFKRLFDAELKANEIVERIDQNVTASAPVVEAPYLAQSARTNSPLFRADSVINAVASEPVVMEEAVIVASNEEEENEDLRPTKTTVQYRTLDSANSSVATAKFSLSKKEKAIIGAFIGIVVMMFALIIVNSAIIAGINSDISALQGVLDTTHGAYAGISSTLTDLQAGFLARVADWVEDTHFILG